MEMRKASPVVFADTRGMSRRDWLSARRKGIGGSDAAAILGLSPYRSPLSVWAEKISEEPLEEETLSETQWRGNVLEDPIARRYASESGQKVVRCNMMLQHPEHPFMLANIDRRIKGKRIGVEIKSVSPNSRTDFEGGEINPSYYCQCMHYLAVTGWDKWILVVWVVDRGMYTFEIEPVKKEIDALIEAERKFWEGYVIPHTMPPVDGTEASAEALKLRFPMSNGQEVTLDCEEDVARFVLLDEQIKSLKAEQEIAKQRIQERMGDNEVGMTANYTVSWKSTKPRSSFDSKRLLAEQPDIYQHYVTAGAPTRRFTVKKAKGA